MRRILIAIAMLFFFTANQAAMAYNQCNDRSCVSGVMDAEKQSEHQKKDPACVAHCSVSHHHAVAMPQDMTASISIALISSLQWAANVMPESAVLEGLAEPPSRA